MGRRPETTSSFPRHPRAFSSWKFSSTGRVRRPAPFSSSTLSALRFIPYTFQSYQSSGRCIPPSGNSCLRYPGSSRDRITKASKPASARSVLCISKKRTASSRKIWGKQNTARFPAPRILAAVCFHCSGGTASAVKERSFTSSASRAASSCSSVSAVTWRRGAGSCAAGACSASADMGSWSSSDTFTDASLLQEERIASSSSESASLLRALSCPTGRNTPGASSVSRAVNKNFVPPVFISRFRTSSGEASARSERCTSGPQASALRTFPPTAADTVRRICSPGTKTAFPLTGSCRVPRTYSFSSRAFSASSPSRNSGFSFRASISRPLCRK